jgi:hypothetical protein
MRQRSRPEATTTDRRACVPNTQRTTTARSCSTPTGTTSRPSTTAARRQAPDSTSVRRRFVPEAGPPRGCVMIGVFRVILTERSEVDGGNQRQPACLPRDHWSARRRGPTSWPSLGY